MAVLRACRRLCPALWILFNPHHLPHLLTVEGEQRGNVSVRVQVQMKGKPPPPTHTYHELPNRVDVIRSRLYHLLLLKAEPRPEVDVPHRINLLVRSLSTPSPRIELGTERGRASTCHGYAAALQSISLSLTLTLSGSPAEPLSLRRMGGRCGKGRESSASGR